MKNFKFVFAAALLLLLTAAVFAGRPKFSNDIYAYDSSSMTFYPIATGVVLVRLTTSSAGNPQQAEITDRSGYSFLLYLGNSTSTPLYTTTNF